MPLHSPCRAGGLAFSALAAALAGCALGTAPREVPEPAVQRIHLEDRAVAIDELRVRGQTERVVVTPKLPGAPAYEILPANRGQDPSQTRGAPGQRVWSLLDF